MRTDALIRTVCDDWILDNLCAVLHQFWCVIEWRETRRAKSKGFCNQGRELHGEIVDLFEVTLERSSETRNEVFLWPLSFIEQG